jgi:sn-glycerol 3-phosphate transport system permease protein
VCGSILAVQMLSATAAGYAFARLDFPGRDWVFAALLLPPALLIAPNLATFAWLHVYDRLVGIMASYFASAFGLFLGCAKPFG